MLYVPKMRDPCDAAGAQLPAELDARLVVVARDGVLVGEPGWGRPVPQAMPPATPRNVDKTSAAIVRPALAAE